MQLRYEPTDNTLRLTLNDQEIAPVKRIEITGYVEMATGGRLAGVELLAPTGRDLQALLACWVADNEAGDYVSIAGSSAYIELSEAASAVANEPTRTAPANLRVELGNDGCMTTLAIPRHGTGYEITYPSGNQ